MTSQATSLNASRSLGTSDGVSSTSTLPPAPRRVSSGRRRPSAWSRNDAFDLRLDRGPMVRLAACRLRHMTMVLAGLEVDRARMAANPDASLGLPYAESVSMALAPLPGRTAAHALVESASNNALQVRRPLLQVLLDDGDVRRYLDEAAIRALFAPGAGLGRHAHWIDRVLAHAPDAPGA